MKIKTDKVTDHHCEHLNERYLQAHVDERLRFLEGEESHPFMLIVRCVEREFLCLFPLHTVGLSCGMEIWARPLAEGSLFSAMSMCDTRRMLRHSSFRCYPSSTA